MKVVPSAAGLAVWYAENRILAWICLLIFVNQLGFGAIVPTVPLYARTFDVPLAAIGLTIAAYGLARFLVGLPAGLISDTFGRRYALALGGLITVAGNLLCAIAPSYLPFLLARFIAGFGAGLVITASQIMLADISTPERRGRMMATYSAVFSLAVGFGPLPGGLLADAFGLSAPFWAYAGMGGLAAVLAWFRVPETKYLRTAMGGVSHADRPSFWSQVRLLAVQRPFLLVCLVGFTAFFARTGALFSLIPVLAQERIGMSPDQLGLALTAMNVAAALLTVPAGTLADRIGRKKMIVPATTMTGVSMLLFMVAPSFPGFLLACAAWSLALGLGQSSPEAYVADSARPGTNASTMSTFRMLSETGYVIGPFILGVIADGWGTNTALLTTAAFAMSVAALFALFAPEKRRLVAAAPAS
ncbi:MAG: MFS transporter [Chloroflexi bacterium]|nr:MFS transporter [Chloroflexota bacterium]